MVSTKEEFIKAFLPESVTDITLTQINLDITDLSIADILRNVNLAYPANTRKRNAIISGHAAIGILCKTETLDPMQGIFLLITGGDLDIEVVSRRYIVICVDESKIVDDDKIQDAIVRITNALVKIFKDDISNLGDFYRKFVYDPYELEIDKEAEYAAEEFNT